MSSHQRVDVALASCRNLPEPDPDSEPLVGALRDRGMSVAVAAWDGDELSEANTTGAVGGIPQFDWASAAVVLLRSTWNYYLDRDRFLEWIDAVDAVTTLHNPAAVVRWNTDKRYLADLEARAVAVVPTVHLARGGDVDVEAICAERGWERVVVKPAVSAASFETYVMTAGLIRHDIVATLLAGRDMMVQPFIESVHDYGEQSIVVIDGEPTHSVRKSPRFGGDDEAVSGPMPIAEDERALAIAAIAAAEDITSADRLLYARVDMARGSDDRPMVMELELTEPSLFFAQGPAALSRLADRLAVLRSH